MKPRLPGENPYSFAGTSDDPFWRQYDPSTHADRFWKRQVIVTFHVRSCGSTMHMRHVVEALGEGFCGLCAGDFVLLPR